MQAKTYCLCCVAGRENRICSRLKDYGYAPIAPQVKRWKPVNGKLTEKSCALLPGYIFFDADEEPIWRSIEALDGVQRILRYDDGEAAMRGADLEFAEWLKRHEGVIEISKVIKVGTKIEFIDGPLTDMAGRIVKVNRSRRQVQIDLGGDGGLMHTVWCSIEYVEANSDTAKLERDES